MPLVVDILQAERLGWLFMSSRFHRCLLLKGDIEKQILMTGPCRYLLLATTTLPALTSPGVRTTLILGFRFWLLRNIGQPHGIWRKNDSPSKKVQDLYTAQRLQHCCRLTIVDPIVDYNADGPLICELGNQIWCGRSHGMLVRDFWDD